MGMMLGLFAAVLALVVLNVPIAVARGVVAVVAMVSSHGVDILPNLAVVTYNGATSFPLLAIPLFILAGAIMNASGISQRLIAFATSLFGWIRGEEAEHHAHRGFLNAARRRSRRARRRARADRGLATARAGTRARRRRSARPRSESPTARRSWAPRAG